MYYLRRISCFNPILCPFQLKPDSIAVGDWSFDEHMTGKYAVPDGKGGYTVTLEGNFWPSIAEGCGDSAQGHRQSPRDKEGVLHNPSQGNEYDVPYSAIIPKKGTGGNLLVPVCLSASAVAYSSTRIESMFMCVGLRLGRSSFAASKR